MPSNNTFQVNIIRKILNKFSVADTAHSDKSVTFAGLVACHDCYFTFIHASGFFRLSFNVYLSLKEQESTKRIEKISVVTLHVFAFHNSAGGITFSAAVNVNKGLAVNAVYRSLFNILFPLIGVLFSIFAARNVCLLYKVTRRTLGLF